MISASIKKIKKIKDKSLSLTGPREQEKEDINAKFIMNLKNGAVIGLGSTASNIALGPN